MRGTILNILVTVFVYLLVASTVRSEQIIYVDTDAMGANNGLSWADAYRNLQDAIADANGNEKPVEVRMAQGVYKPDRGTGIAPGDKLATFRLMNGVNIKGGYAGFGEPDPNARDVKAYETILSGDLQGNDGPILANMTDNSCHVVTGSYADATAVLDGFTIKEGCWSPVLCKDGYMGGAGMYIQSGSPTIINCLFSENSTFGTWGVLSVCNGGMPTIVCCTFTGNDGSSVIVSNGRLVLTDCTFSDNRGNGINGYNSGSLTATNCTFENNLDYGMYVSDYNSTLTGCTFERNSGGIRCFEGRLAMVDCAFIANSERGGIDSLGTTLTLTKCRFTSNSALAVTGVAGGLSARETDATLRQCSFERNTAHFGSGGIDAIGGNLRLYDCTFSGNSGFHGGGLSLTIGACLIATGCTFSGNSTEWANGGGGISAGYAILSNCTFTGNWAKFGKGSAISHMGSDPSQIMKLANCIVWNGNDGIGSWGSGSPEVTVSYSNVQGGWAGEGNIDIDPCFAEPGYWADANDPNIIVEPGEPNAVWLEGDYHLKSQAGRWDPMIQTWVKDNETSPCIDAGNPDSPIGLEPFPNGGIINMGAYGGTAEASKSYFGEPICETIVAGDINGDCKVNLEDFTTMASHWLLYGTDLINKPPTVIITQPANGEVFDQGSVITIRADAGDVDSSVVKVEFSMKSRTDNGSSSVHMSGTHGTDRWECKWHQASDHEANWTITAEATDDDGAMTVSPEVVVTILGPK